MILFFDMPMENEAQQKSYRTFRKYLKSNGYIPLQKSVYLRVFRNGRSINEEYNRVRKSFPKEGTVSMLPIGMTAFDRMQTIGESKINNKELADDIVFI